MTNRVSPFQEKIAELKAEQAGLFTLGYGRQFSVVILGAGPAGLIRGIQSIMNGHKTQIVERRAEDEGRLNTVALNAKSVSLLQRYGIYQWLIENRVVFPFEASTRPYISVRLQDFERAAKAVLQELEPNPIRYECKVQQIETKNQKADLIVEANGKLETLPAADLIVNCEGSHSSTNQLLGIERVEFLPKVPVIAAFFQDNRPKITGVGTLFEYVGKTIFQCAAAVYYFAIFFFKFIFQGERYTHPDRNIAGALMLKTPGQNYFGCGFSKAHSDQLLALKQDVDVLQRAPEKAKELTIAKQKYETFARYWINLSFCAAKFWTLFTRIIGKQSHHETAEWLPLYSFNVIHIGADHAKVYSQKLRNTAYVVCGDAAATVDPTTGLGANMAIQTSIDFEELMIGMRLERDATRLLKTYDDRISLAVQNAHSDSLTLRQIYRPDASQVPPLIQVEAY